MRSNGNMSKIANHAIVVNTRGCVHDASTTNPYRRIYYRTRHNGCSLTNNNILCYDRRGVNQSNQPSSGRSNLILDATATIRIPYCYKKIILQIREKC